VVVAVAQNTIGRYIAWNWFRNNWVTISNTFDTAISSAVGRMIQVKMVPQQLSHHQQHL
jgi:hypothetical protein